MLSAYVGNPTYLCTNLLDPGDYTASFPLTVFETQRVYESPPIPVARLFNSQGIPTSCRVSVTCNSTNACATAITTQAIGFWAQTNSTAYPDNIDLSIALNLVGQGPTAPTQVTATAGSEAIVVNWTWPAGFSPATDSSFLGVQILCQRQADSQVFASGTYAPAFMTSTNLCPNTVPTTSPNSDFGNRDPRYLCSGLLPPTATSCRIIGLENGIPYSAGVVAVDKYGNLSDISDIAYATPSSAISDPRYGARGGGCEVDGQHERPSALAGLLVLGLVAARLSRRSRS